MRHLWLLLCLAVLTVVTWPDEHGRGGILFSEWELRQAIRPDRPSTERSYQIASLTEDSLLNEAPVERSEALPLDIPELPGSAGETGPAEPAPAARAPAPQVAIEDVCVAMASAAQINDLPVGFLARLIWQESKFGQWVVSHAGAQGVAQFMPKTAAWIGLPDPFDPISALPASAKFLRMLYTQFGNLGLAAAAYNGGPGRLQNWLAGRGALPDETRNYVKIITGHDVDKWKEARDIEVSFHLPAKAPCEGLAGLSRQASPEKLAVTVEPAIVRLIETARAEAAKRVARAALLAKKLAARKKGGRTKMATGGRPAKEAPGKKTAAGTPLKLATN